MNILPKKRWHVRTKENIARVRKDEAKAAEEERVRQERAKLAESEARRQFLLEKSRKKFATDTFIPLDSNESTSSYVSVNTEHVNFFKELEEGTANQNKTNKEHDEEIKKEKEKYEKQIGYLTYLGQDTNEALGKKSWYEVLPERLQNNKGEVNLKSKTREDPLNIIKKYTNISKSNHNEETVSKFKEYKSLLSNKSVYKSSKKKKRHQRESSEEPKRRKKEHASKKSKKSEKKHRSRSRTSSSASNDTPPRPEENHSDSDSEDEKLRKAETHRKLEQLRAERLQREKEEKRKTEALLSKIRGDSTKEKPSETKGPKRKYNSQFNPELAKQNYM
ncbi:leukocyte receptor cluster member 1 homolog [Rhynchophorus ferrugineus]|uniref:leukocyte receptor cluster member 1 homolog n=1 Tax=Rhynchophorus ferrugineus TaxID=354439 RepID=UPI003FCD4ACF